MNTLIEKLARPCPRRCPAVKKTSSLYQRQKRGAPKGNKNALGNSGNWVPRGTFITRQLINTLLADSKYSVAQQSKLVQRIVKQLIIAALEGDMRAIKEITRRIEGRW